MKKTIVLLTAAILAGSCGDADMKYWHRVDLPEGYGDSHILSIDIKDNGILLGTYGKGALFSRDNGASWTVFDTTGGLSWNFILGGDWIEDYLVLATLGDGLNISEDGGKNWLRCGYNFFGIEYLYSVGAKISEGVKYVPTADGLVVFDSLANWKSITEKNGLGSQYLFDMKIKGDTIALGTLHGYSISYDKGVTWTNFSPNGIIDRKNRPSCKVRAVEFTDQAFFAGCDDGLYASGNRGKNWERLGSSILVSPFIHDLVIDKENNLWVATYKEVALYDLGIHGWKIFDRPNGLPEEGANCLNIASDGRIYVGTNHGLYQLGKEPFEPQTAKPLDDEFGETEEPIHQWMLRPVGPDDQNLKDQTYLYGSTMGGNFRQHQGNEYNAPEGAPILAVDNGVMVFVDREIGHSVLKCDTRQDNFIVYAHYHHQFEILKKAGDKVKRGDIIGKIGKKGNVTNEHLHFEVSLSTVDDSNKESHTRNPELWVETLPGTGTIIGRLTDSDDNPVPGVRIYGIAKPVPSESPFSFAETYRDQAHPDEFYAENFVIGDVPAGEYILRAASDGKSAAVKALVEAGRVTRIKMALK